MTGLLVTGPLAVAAALQVMFASDTSPRRMGLHGPPGHVITAADVVSVERAMIRLRLDDDGHLAQAFDVVGGASPASSIGRGRWHCR